MTQLHHVLPLTGLLALAACAISSPAGPTVMALPPQGKTFETFQEDEVVCRTYASQMAGGIAPAQAGQQAAVGSAVLGTAVGAGLGAALGSLSGAAGAGAAVGGAAGLLMGSAIGANNANASAASLQQTYDTAYTQCMYARGNAVQAAPALAYAPAGYGYGAYAPYPPPYYGPYGGTSVVVGGTWGWGGYYRPRYYPRRWGYW